MINQQSRGFACTLLSPSGVSPCDGRRCIGARTYFSLANAQGGVKGRRLELEAKGDGYEASNAASCWESLEKAGVFATVFFVGTPTAR
jgi:hypothetical protein